ncbi:MAG TPA: glycosyltransferase [Solirubrobacteraceae bacterium]|nr:glycosyltransferase [Solirubrobacteraceae bacterium]
MNVCILLLSVDEAPMLEWSLPAAVTQEPAAEVVVVDNASSDETGALAARHGACHLRLERRLTYAAAINEAIRRTAGDAVLLLNADCRLRPGFLAAALPRLAKPGVGSVAPKLLRAARPPLSSSTDQIDTAAMVIDRRRKNGLVGHARPAQTYGRPAAVFGADGAAALYRREVLASCMLDDGEVLDEDMELWASDADLAWRAQLLGWRSVYEPGAVAEHVRTYSPSTRDQMSEAARRLQFRNRYLMMIKNETAAGLARDLPWIVGYEVVALGHVLLRERHLLGGYRDAWRLRDGAWRRRAAVQARRRRLATPVRRAIPPFGLRASE